MARQEGFAFSGVAKLSMIGWAGPAAARRRVRPVLNYQNLSGAPLAERHPRARRPALMFDRRWIRWPLLLLWLPGAALGASGPEPALWLGIHPYLAPSELVERFTPLAHYLSDRVGRPVEVQIANDYASHLDAIAQGRVDIAFLGPVPYVELVDRCGDFPLLGRLEIGSHPTLRGVIVARSDSPVRSLRDLVGRRVAFGDPQSTMSSVIPRHMLHEQGIALGQLASYSFIQNHENVALGVLTGDFDAGAVKEEVFDRYRARGLKAIAYSPEVSEHVFVARQGLDRELVEALREAMLELRTADASGNIRGSIKGDMTGVVPADDSDYDTLRLILADLWEQEASR